MRDSSLFIVGIIASHFEIPRCARNDSLRPLIEVVIGRSPITTNLYNFASVIPNAAKRNEESHECKAKEG